MFGSSSRRSPSLHSISTATSAFSFSENHVTIPNSPSGSVRGASQGAVSDWINQEQQNQLHEQEGAVGPASLKYNDQSRLLEASQALPAYPLHKHFYFPAENIYFLVRIGYEASTVKVLTGFDRSKACSTAFIATSLNGIPRRSSKKGYPNRSPWSS